MSVTATLRNLLLLLFCLTTALQPAQASPKTPKQKLAQTQADSALMLLAVHGNNQDSLSKSLHYISQAISNDPAIEYYNHKFAILCQMGNHRKAAIALLDTMKTIGNQARTYSVMQGNLFEKEKQPQKAMASYRSVIAQCDSLLKINPNNTPALTDRILAIQFAYDKETLLKEYNKTKVAHPTKPEILELEELVKGFDKQKVLSGFCR